MKNDLANTSRLYAHTFIDKAKGTREVNTELILEVIDKVSAMHKAVGEEINKELIFQQLMDDYSIGEASISSMSDDNILPWLKDEKASIDFLLWNRYRSYLSEKDPSFPISSLDDFTK